MCDRFAARALVDHFGAVVRRPDGDAADRAEWDFQDLNGFVAGAMRRQPGIKRLERAAREGAVREGNAGSDDGGHGQMFLFSS